MADSARQDNPQHWLRLQPRRDERFLRAEGTAEARSAGRSGAGCIASLGGSLERRAFRCGTCISVEILKMATRADERRTP